MLHLARDMPNVLVVKFSISLLKIRLFAVAIVLLTTTKINATSVVLSFDNDPSEVVFQIGDTTDSFLILPTSITFRNLPSNPSASYTWQPTNSFKTTVIHGPLLTFWINPGTPEFILHDFGGTVGLAGLSTWDDLIALGTIGLGNGIGTNAYLEWNEHAINTTIYAPMSFSESVTDTGSTAALLGVGAAALAFARHSLG